MKVLLVAAKDDFKNLLSYHLNPVGFEIVHYRDPVKALDNLEELNPDLVLFHSGDFPRHWKPLLEFLRNIRNKEETVFILIKGEKTDLEEVAKATHLGANGFVSENFSDKQEIYRLEELFRRYKTIEDKRKFHRLIPGECDRLKLMFTHPLKTVLINGTIREISISGVSFKPENPSLTEDIPVGQTIRHCSLRVANDIIHIDCRVTRNSEDIGFQFNSFSPGGHKKLFRYIQDRPKRELEYAVKEGSLKN